MNTITFKSPIAVHAASQYDGGTYDIDPSSGVADLINEEIRTDSFWGENQTQFVNDWDTRGVLQEVYFSAKYTDGQLWGITKVTTSKVLTGEEEIHLLASIAGQFSDGWGESFEQTDLGNFPEVFYASFWKHGTDWAIVRV